MGNFTHIWSALRHYHSSASSGGDICGKTPAFRSKTSRVAKRDDFHSKLLFSVKNKGQWNAKSGPKVADGNVAMRTQFSGRLESK